MPEYTKSEFDAHLEAGTLRLANEGMSNVGKGHSATLLRKEMGFVHYEVDAVIGNDLGLSTMDELTQWLYPTPETPPDDLEVQANTAKYLELEDRLTKAVPLDTGQNLVLDTTGSLAHLKTMTDWLPKNFLVVYLRVLESQFDLMFDRFIAEPKPVIWGHLYDPADNETTEATYKRCYPKLLKYRDERYAQLAHVTLHRDIENHAKLTAESFLEEIRSQLPDSHL